MKKAFAVLLAVLGCVCTGESAEGISVREILAPRAEDSFRIEARGTREIPGDLSPAQVFELVNLTGEAVKLGRLTTSCGCIVLLSPKDEYAAGEKIELTLHNIRPSSGHTYAFFVHVESPVRRMVQRDVYVISTLPSSVDSGAYNGQNMPQPRQQQGIPTMHNVDALPNAAASMTEQNASGNRTLTEQQQNTGGVGGALGFLLPELLAVWPKVPEAVKTGILAMIQAAVIAAQDEK